VTHLTLSNHSNVQRSASKPPLAALKHPLPSLCPFPVCSSTQSQCRNGLAHSSVGCESNGTAKRDERVPDGTGGIVRARPLRHWDWVEEQTGKGQREGKGCFRAARGGLLARSRPFHLGPAHLALRCRSIHSRRMNERVCLQVHTFWRR
jgi:hypothetical protein